MQDKRDHPHSPGQFVGSAVVAGASYGHGTTNLQLQSFTGEFIDYPFGGIPDPEGAAKFRGNNFRPISVKIEDGGERCSVIVLTSDGTQRAIVTLGIALALHQSGVHAVVEGGLQARLSCFRHNSRTT